MVHRPRIVVVITVCDNANESSPYTPARLSNWVGGSMIRQRWRDRTKCGGWRSAESGTSFRNGSGRSCGRDHICTQSEREPERPQPDSARPGVGPVAALFVTTAGFRLSRLLDLCPSCLLCCCHLLSSRPTDLSPGFCVHSLCRLGTLLQFGVSGPLYRRHFPTRGGAELAPGFASFRWRDG